MLFSILTSIHCVLRDEVINSFLAVNILMDNKYLYFAKYLTVIDGFELRFFHMIEYRVEHIFVCEIYEMYNNLFQISYFHKFLHFLGLCPELFINETL